MQVLLGLPRVLLVREALPLDEHPPVVALAHLAQQRFDLVVAVAIRAVVHVHDPDPLPQLLRLRRLAARRRRRLRGCGSAGAWLGGGALAPLGGQPFGLSVGELERRGAGPLAKRRLVRVGVGVIVGVGVMVG